MRKTLANKLTANLTGAVQDGKTACVTYRPYGICRLGKLGSILRKTEMSRFHQQKILELSEVDTIDDAGSLLWLDVATPVIALVLASI